MRSRTASSLPTRKVTVGSHPVHQRTFADHMASFCLQCDYTRRLVDRRRHKREIPPRFALVVDYQTFDISREPRIKEYLLQIPRESDREPVSDLVIYLSNVFELLEELWRESIMSFAKQGEINQT